jgi:hypothetical protein
MFLNLKSKIKQKSLQNEKLFKKSPRISDFLWTNSVFNFL